MKFFRCLFFAGFALAILLPLFSLVLWAFAARWPWPDLLPVFTLKGFVELGATDELSALLKGAGLSFLVALLSTAMALPASRTLAFFDFRGKRLAEGLLLLPLFVPPIAVALGVQLLFLKLGIANSAVGVVAIQIVPCMPYTVYLLKNGFEAFGTRYEEQALSLGASPLRVWWDVTLPLLRPYLAGALWMAFLVSSGQYLLTFQIGGGLVETPTTQLFAYIQNGERRAAAVLSLFFLLLCMALSRLLNRFGYSSQSTICSK